MATNRITVSKSSPSVTFYLDADWISQNQAGNYSTMRIYIRMSKGTSSYFLNSGAQIAVIDGIGEAGRHQADPFLPSSLRSWSYYYDVNIGHDANGYASGRTLRMQLRYGSINTDHLGWIDAPARIPKVPAAPTPIGIDQITADSFRYRFSGNDNGGSAIIEWQYQLATNSSFTTGVTTGSSGGTSTITDLANHTQYWIRSRGRNAVGWGPYSSASTAATLGHPTAPLNVVATPSSSVTGRIGLSWSPPTTTGEGGIVGYNIYRDGVEIATTTGTGTGYTDNGRTPYTSYSYTVAARNAYSTSVAGVGPQSSASVAVAPGPPSAPTNLTGVSSGSTPGQVILSWTAPVNTGAGGITGYNIRLADGTFIASTTGTPTTYTVNNLTPGVAYTFKVSARNALADTEGSESAFSNQVIVTPIGEPNAPTGVTVSVSPTTSNRLVISWTSPGGVLSGYNIFRRVNGSDTLIATVNSSHTSFAVDNVASGTAQTYVVRARTVYTDTLPTGYPGNWGGPASTAVTQTATSNNSQSVSSLSAVISGTNAVFNGTYVITQVTSTTIRYNKSSDNIPLSSSGGTIQNVTNAVFNGTFNITATTATSFSYAKTNSNIGSLATSGGLATDNTNVSFNGTFTVTSVNSGANLVSYNNSGSNIASRAVPVNTPPGASGLLKNLSNTIFNGTGFVLTAVTANTLSFAKTNANVAESNAAGTVTNVTNRDTFNGKYLISTIPSYNVVRYIRTAANIAVRSWYEPNGIVHRTTSPSTLDVKFRSGWAG